MDIDTECQIADARQKVYDVVVAAAFTETVSSMNVNVIYDSYDSGQVTRQQGINLAQFVREVD